MKAIVYEGIKDVKVKEVPDPSIEEHDDIIVKVTSTAICGSDLHLVHGLVEEIFFSKNIALKRDKCPARSYINPILVFT